MQIIEWTLGVSKDDWFTDRSGRRCYESPQTMRTTWSELGDVLADCASIGRDPVEKDGDETHPASTPWISAAIRKPGARRRRIEDIDHCAAHIWADIDAGNLPLEFLAAKTGPGGIIYSTTHARPDNRRWRVGVPLSRSITVAEYPRCFRWYAALFEGYVDRKTRNANRISYVPAAWTGAANVFHRVPGPTEEFNVDAILRMMPPDPEPIVEFKDVALGNAPDGTPIITPSMLTRACGERPGGRLYRLMCAAASRYRANGWDLDKIELAAAGLLASESFAAGKRRPDALREAERALEWAACNVEPLTQIEKIRRRILWQQAYRRSR